MTLATIRRTGGTDAVRAAITAALAGGTPADAARALGCSWSDDDLRSVVPTASREPLDVDAVRAAYPGAARARLAALESAALDEAARCDACGGKGTTRIPWDHCDACGGTGCV